MLSQTVSLCIYMAVSSAKTLALDLTCAVRRFRYMVRKEKDGSEYRSRGGMNSAGVSACDYLLLSIV